MGQKDVLRLHHVRGCPCLARRCSLTEALPTGARQSGGRGDRCGGWEGSKWPERKRGDSEDSQEDSWETRKGWRRRGGEGQPWEL